MTINLILAIVVAILQVGDGVTTAINLSSPGGREHNPVIRKLMDALGVIPALVLKGALVSALAVAAALYAPGDATTVLLGALSAAYAFLVVKNAGYFL